MATNNATNTSNPVTFTQGGTGLSTATPYAVICGGTTSTGNLQAVSSVGTAGWVLTSQGGSTLPHWVPNSAGSLIFLQSQTVTNVATVVFNSGLTYNSCVFLFSSVYPVTSTATLGFQVTDNSGLVTSGYACGLNYNAYNSASPTNTNSTTHVILSGPLATSVGLSGFLNVQNVTNGAPAGFNGVVTFDGSSSGLGTFGLVGGSVTSNSTLSAFTFSMSSGNIASGTISLFGLVE